MRREAGSPKILVVLWKLIIPELRVLVLTKTHVGSGNEIVPLQAVFGDTTRKACSNV